MDQNSARRRVTQKDVASHAGVSTSIVSYVINNGPRSVSQETRDRVLRSIDELDYRPNKHARMLMRSQSEPEIAVRQFGVIIGGDPSFFTRPFYGAILSGIYEEAHRLQMRVRFLQFLDDLSDPVLFNELIHPEEVSGLLLFSYDAGCPSEDPRTTAHEATMHKILDRIDNVICLERQWDNLPAVVFDREKAAQTAVSHLISMGHERIGYLGSLDDRLIGYRNALFDQGLVYDESVICDCISNTPEEGRGQTLALMGNGNGKHPTALFACSDEVAIGVIGALDELNLRVPQDMAVASIDDIEFATLFRPRLTSVNVPKSQMGAYAVRMLHDRNVQTSDPAVSVVLPTELIVRESCGAALPEVAMR